MLNNFFRVLENINLILDDLRQLNPANQNVQLSQLEFFKRIRQIGNDQWKSYINDGNSVSYFNFHDLALEGFRFVENVARYITMFFIQPSCYNDIRPCLLYATFSE